jgi:hypothetical protein
MNIIMNSNTIYVASTEDEAETLTIQKFILHSQINCMCQFCLHLQSEDVGNSDLLNQRHEMSS